MNPGEIIVSVIIVLISLTFHEAAHATTSYFMGDPTAKSQGRLSLNPIVHIDLFGTIIIPLILAAIGGVIFGWAKPVPVNPSNLKNPKRDEGIIAASGPMTNLALAVISTAILRIINGVPSEWLSVGVGDYIRMILVFAILINIFLALLNLIPISPLDGASVLNALLSPSASVKFQKINKYGFFILLGLLFFTDIIDKYYFNLIGKTLFQFLIRLTTG